jgi:hypothetical protein
MPNIYLLMAAIFLAIFAALYFAPSLRLLNFIDYDGVPDVAVLNRYAAVRMLLPVAASAVCAAVAWRHPALSVPLIVVPWLSVLAAVGWIIVGSPRR